MHLSIVLNTPVLSWLFVTLFSQLLSADRSIAACTAVDNSAAGATLTCSSDTDSQIDICNDGFYLMDGVADACTGCVAVANSAADAVLTCSSAGGIACEGKSAKSTAATATVAHL